MPQEEIPTQPPLENGAGEPAADPLNPGAPAPGSEAPTVPEPGGVAEPPVDSAAPPPPSEEEVPGTPANQGKEDSDKKGERVDAGMIPPTETDPNQGRGITVKRGIRKFGGLRHKLGIDEESLKGAGVLSTEEAQAGQDAAIAADSDSGRLAEGTSGMNNDTRRRAGHIHKSEELIGTR